MNKLKPIIKNKFGEKLDTWVEVPDGEIKANVIMVHGFGTSKHETAGYFNDLAAALVANNFRVIRFDLSGYGNSEGREEDACYSKHLHDVLVVTDYVKANFSEPLYFLSQSMGTWITALAMPKDVEKSVFTGIPNSNTQIVLDRFVERFGSRPGAKLDMEGISLLPRSTGKVQKLGKCFWDDIKALNPINAVKNYAKTTNLLIIHWDNDEIIGKDFLAEYDQLDGVKSLWMPGNHSVSNPSDRANFIKVLLDFFNN